MKKLLLTLALLCLTGCTTTNVRLGDVEFSRTQFGTRQAIGKFKAQLGTNYFELENYNSDQVEALSAVTQAAVEAAIKSQKP